MKPPTAEERMHRMVRLAWRIYHGGEVTTAWIRKRFGVSKATAKRDLAMLAKVLPVALVDPLAARGMAKRIAVPRVVRTPLNMDAK